MPDQPPAGILAREIRDANDDRAQARIERLDDAEYLQAVIEVETDRDSPRQQRVAWANRRLREVKDDE